MFIFRVINYFYILKCFRMIIENDLMHNTYNLKLTRIGIMYTVLKVDKETPYNTVPVVISNRLTALNDVMIGMNLDGIVSSRTKKITEIEIDDEINDYYLVELYPHKLKSTMVYMVIIMLLLIWLVVSGVKHHNEVWQFITHVYDQIHRKIG